VQRQTDPADPLNDAVTVGLQWLTSAKAANGTTIIENIPLVQTDGIVERIYRVGIAPSAAADLDYVAPASTIYFRPHLDLYGDTSAVTDVLTIDVRDVTEAFLHNPLNVQTPSSGATIALSKLRPLFINNPSPLATLTIRMPAGPVSNDAVEISFLSEVTSLALQTSAGATIATAPTSADGPRAAIYMKYINDSIGWVYWK
jgi:hypothetical protein